jgi:nucleotide-binding universal stress UspA family protein
MKKILVLTDFSEAARHAAGYAIKTAADLQAEIVLLHIYQVPLLYAEAKCTMTQDDLQQVTVKELEMLAEDLSREGDKKVAISTEIRTGTFFVELTFACGHHDPYLVVMGAYGNTASRYLLWGSHTVYCMKHLPYPLLAVPATAHYVPVKKICFVLDGNDVAFAVPADTILQLCNDLHAKLFILSSNDKVMHENDTRRQSTLLEKELASIQPSVHMIGHHRRDSNILNFCERFNIDLLIIVPKAHAVLDVFYQNDVRQFISNSNIPVLSLHKKVFY